MQLRSGKEHSSGHGKAGLGELLEELGARGPALVRGDSAYGNQDIIEICEKHDRRYLLRLRKTANVKRLIERLFNCQDWTAPNEASQGCQAIEDKLRLAGWSKERRVVALRRPIKRAVALVYNWWSWYVRAANPQARREALTSRPLLLAAVGRATHSGGRTELHLTPMHAEVGLIKTMITNIQAAIAYVRRAAEQLPKTDRWRVLLGYICERITRQTVLPSPPPGLAGVG